MLRRVLQGLIAVSFGLVSVGMRAEVKLASVFGDHMVLQRGVKLPVWGWSKPGDVVTVTLGQATKSATTAASGRWEVSFDALPAGGPLAMAVIGSEAGERGKVILVKDILVGDVWLGSGQSNMDFRVAAGDRYWCGVMNEQAEVAAANWPQIRMFKVGLKMTDAPEKDVQGQWMVTTPETVKDYSAVGYFLSRDLYEHLHVPIGFIDASFGASTVQAWISPEAMQQHADYAYLLEAYAKAKADWVKDGPAKTEAYEKAMPAWAEKAAKELSEGKYEPRGPSLGDPGQNQHNPSVLFNGMIAPIVGYPIKGAVWYQGESNEDAKSAAIYRSMMETMIGDWRGRWGEGEFPFLYVQLANLGQLALTPPEHAPIAYVREQQRLNLSVPNTAMAVTIDIGDAGNVHPKNKQELCRRLALMARKLAYGETDVVSSGPMYDGFTVDGGKVMVRFKDAEGGLATKGGTPIGFAVAGTDKRWAWAEAKIENDTVVLTPPAGMVVVAVRYGYADNPPVNLFAKGENGLPAVPFKSDTW
jgi:sialate O-acetylesterase